MQLVSRTRARRHGVRVSGMALATGFRRFTGGAVPLTAVNTSFRFIERSMIQPTLPATTPIPDEKTSPLDSQARNLLHSQKSQAASLRNAFNDFVGQTFYSQMLSAMRKTVDKPAYFDGGRAEEIFQAQLDQTLSEKLADATADKFTGPMFELFNLSRG